jgi:hypothetical protein
MSLQHVMTRITERTAWPNPDAVGGPPEYTVGDCALIASQAPHMSFHAIMAKFCGDVISANRIHSWLHDTSLTEWFLNPVNERRTVGIGQVNKLVELAIIGWAVPFAAEVSTIASRAAYIGAAKETYRTRYQPHYSYLTGELSFLEHVARRAIDEYKTEVS